MRGQTPRLNHPEIGRNLGARLQQYNVAGHQFDRLGGVIPRPISQDGSTRRLHLTNSTVAISAVPF